MKLYKFRMTAIVAAPDMMDARDVVSVSRVLKEEYQRQFLGGVLMDNIKIEAEPINETTFS